MGKSLKDMGKRPERRQGAAVLTVCLIIVAAITSYNAYNDGGLLDYQELAIPACTEVTKTAEVVTFVAKDSLSPALASCLGRLPAWITEGPARMAKEFKVGSLGLTDKSTGHKYHLFYHRYLAPIARRTCYPDNPKKIRFLEIGLGCAPGGGMIQGKPGGSSIAWKHLFPSPEFDFELHVMEYDAKCALKWAEDHPNIFVHTGDASNTTDLDRVYKEAGSLPFDMVIDDASHINEHQIITVEHMIQYVGEGGIFVIEDIHSSCKNWKANVGQKRGHSVGGTRDCMLTKGGNPTIYAKLVEWQKLLVIQKEPFKNVMHIDINFEAAVLEKWWPKSMSS
jgi:hypothetical protein